MQIRTLRESEREAFLELLDGWDLPDGARGRDFFRRYVEDDPTYRDEHVFVAEDAGRLVSCVQVFPRPLRAAGGARVPIAGIGSVFTRPEARRGGIARRVLEAACAASAARGLPLGVLFAGPIAWYERQGWASWTLERHVARGAGAPRHPERLRDFEVARDLAALRALHERTSETLEGSVVRDDALWQASLRNAGNPDEDVRLARGADGEPLAYARATRLAGARLVTEWGLAETPDAASEEALADVLASLLPEGGVLPNLGRRPGLAARLEARGLALRAVREPFTMLRVLDAAALAAHLRVAPPAPGREAGAWLAEQLPPERFGFWPADRF